MSPKVNKGTAAPEEQAQWPFGRNNYIFFGAAMLTIIVGYIFLGMGEVNGVWSLTLAPILLVIGYCILVPIALIVRSRPDEDISADDVPTE